MKLSYDLHIHTCLSPCGHDDMTPNNILNMAKLKNLDLIGITDHNSGKNVAACAQLGAQLDILVLPGMEVSTREEVHVLCYFQTVEILSAFEKDLDAYRLPIPNRVDKFGNQWVMNQEDQVVERYGPALILSMDLSINDLVTLVRAHNGIAVPAHVNKSSNSILSNLGFMPPDLNFIYVEAFKDSELPLDISEKYGVLYNSDAHFLEQISEPLHYIDVENRSLESVLNYLKKEGS